MRYRKNEASTAPNTKEVAFLRIGYKAAGAMESVLIERPITDEDVYPVLVEVPESTRFATDVAA